jgi:uncharacterized protein (DUF983 family)
MPFDTVPTTPTEPNRWLKALTLGFRRLCPQCGCGYLYLRYLKVQSACEGCGLPLASYRSDDAPPYFTILLVGHIVVPAMLLLEQTYHPPEWLHLALWVPLTLALTLTLLPRIKGAVIGWQWAAAIKG